jgi:rfaE bifunctional protein nucleotidyltransferase chain/domain
LPRQDKIKSISELAEVLAALRDEGKRIVLCHGCFDLLHIGHIRYLEKAAALGDVLVVTLTPDRFVNKGPHRPAFAEAFRAEALAALDCVDFVAINEWPTAVETLALLRPHIYAKGAEFRENRTPEIVREETAAQAIGVDLAFIEDITSSSSQLINRHLSPFPAEVDQYLIHIGETYGAEGILGFLERCRGLRVLVVGETIIEEYHYCQMLQRSLRAPVLAMQYQTHERFLGGAAAIANHLSGFCAEVGLLSMLGATNSQDQWVREELQRGVKPAFVYKTDSPTIVTRRYLESYFALPVFEVYEMNDTPLTEADDASLAGMLEDLIPRYDAVLVADQGHAMLSPSAVDLLQSVAPFLAVSAQIDAGNFGYHTITKYPRADYACLAEHEIRLEFRDRGSDAGALAEDLAHRLQARQVAVTRGKHGSVAWSAETGPQEAPSLAVHVADRTGGGAAYFAISALCAFLGAPLEVSSFLGNVAAAQVVAVIGSRKRLEPLSLRRHVESLLR